MKIYQYYSAKKFIQDSFTEKSAKNQSFSVRAWAKKMGLKTHTVLHAVVKGTKNVPLSLYIPISRDLELTSEESHHLLLLINMESAKDQYSRLMLLDQIDTLKKHRRFKMEELADFSLLSDPFWGLLVEMTDIADFQNDPAWIKDHVRIPKSAAEIKAIIATLLEKNILKLVDGKIKKTNQHITNVHDLANIGSQKYHRNAALLAAEQVGLQTVSERDFNGYALNIRERDIPKIKDSIRAFIKEFIVEFEAGPGEGDQVYQLNTQFFSLSRRS